MTKKRITFLVDEKDLKAFTRARGRVSGCAFFRQMVENLNNKKSGHDFKALPVPDFTPEFENFFEFYPRPEGKIQAFYAWVDSKIDLRLAEKISVILWIFMHKNKWNFQTDEGRFWPKPAEFLAQKMWLDCTRKLAHSCHFFDEPAMQNQVEKFFPKVK